MFSEATGVTEQEGQGRRLLFGVCTLGGRDVRKGPECCVISADLFALDITAYGKRPVAGSNQNNTHFLRGAGVPPSFSLSSQF